MVCHRPLRLRAASVNVFVTVMLWAYCVWVAGKYHLFELGSKKDDEEMD
jgi:hypothetical protein